ncbi:MAG: ComEC/Rec2 family competence protein, partial [Planctomycetaceae bacterium]
GRLCIARASVGGTQEGMRTVTDTAAAERVPISLVAAGDRIALDSAVTITVLHPADGETSSHDNANSIVLQIEYAGRRILLTGDVERDGLDRLLSLPERPVDVLMSPHHGSRAANPPQLAAWSDPKIVVVSSGTERPTAFLREIYGEDVAIWCTAESGAVAIEIAADGTVRAAGGAGK